jgi:hypothetical protein
MFLYSLLFIYSLVEIPIETYFFKILNIFSLSLLLVSILGIAQFVQKGSVFDNYLVFGEQPYSSATYGVPKESFFGKGVYLPTGFLGTRIFWWLSEYSLSMDFFIFEKP